MARRLYGKKLLNQKNSTTTEKALAQLLARVTGDYQTVTEIIKIGDVEIRFTRIENPDLLLEQMESNAASDGTVEPANQPYWAQAWESALAVAEELVVRDLSDVRVLDLGCGLGLTGTIAAARGARVVMADAAPPALLFARINSWPWRDRIRTQQVDWRHDSLQERFQLIIGSEIIYDRLDWPYLDQFWKEHLAADGSVLLAEPGRFFGDEFIEWAEQNSDWNIARSARKVEGENRPIRLLELTRR